MDPTTQLILGLFVAIALVMYWRVVLVVGTVFIMTVLVMGLLGMADLLARAL